MIKVIQKLGPGLLFAGAAIGVSHLVQSTRAGADFGFGLLWALLLSNLFKYPFFLFGPKYSLATGESILDGYYKLSKYVLLNFSNGMPMHCKYVLHKDEKNFIRFHLAPVMDD